MLTLWCLGQKREAPKVTVALGAPFWGYFPPLHQEWIIFFPKIFLMKVCHPINEHLEHIWFSLMLTLWCLGQKREAPKSTVALGAPFFLFFLFCSRHQRVRKNLIFIYPQDEGPRGMFMLNVYFVKKKYFIVQKFSIKHFKNIIFTIYIWSSIWIK